MEEEHESSLAWLQTYGASILDNLLATQGQGSSEKTSKDEPLQALPESWWQKLMSNPYLDKYSKLNLFRSSKLLNKVVLQHSRLTSLEFELLNQSQKDAMKALYLASRHAPSIKLKLSHNWEGYYCWMEDKAELEMQQMGHTACSFLQFAAEQGATNAITEIQLEHATLKTILPPAIGQACPNLTKVALIECLVSRDPASSFSSQFRQLQCLELDRVVLRPSLHSKEQITASVPEQHNHLQAELGALPALQSLSIHADWLDIDDPSKVGLDDFKIVNAVASQLTHLRIDLCTGKDDNYEVGYGLCGLNWTELGVRLQHLQLPGAEVNDSYLTRFLAWPGLTRLEVLGFKLAESYAEHPCNWEELTLSSVGVETLTRLPLHSGLMLKVGFDSGAYDGHHASFNLNGVTQDTVRQSMINLSHCKGVQWGERVSVTGPHGDDSPTAYTDRLVLALPLLGAVKRLDLTPSPLTRGIFDGPVMQSLSDFVRGREDHPFLYFSGDCVFKAEHVASLAANMPSDSTLGFFSRDVECDEPLITQLCCAAKRTLHLHVRSVQPKEGFETRLASALQSCGLELEFLWLEPDGLDPFMYPTTRRLMRLTIVPYHSSLRCSTDKLQETIEQLFAKSYTLPRSTLP